MTDGRGETRYLVPGLVRGIEMLRLFSPRRRTMTVPEMARALAVPRSTAYRLVQTLARLRLLEADGSGHSYRLGVGLLGLGFDYLASLDLSEIGRPRLESLRDATGLSSHMVVRDGTEVVVILKAQGHAAFVGSLAIGARLPAHATVLGRVILADLSDDELADLYPDGRLRAYSPQTPTTLAALRARLRDDRARGYAVSQSYFEAGISAVAAPIRDNSGRAVAAINITLPGHTTPSAEQIDSVCQTAAAISRLLDYRSAAGPGELDSDADTRATGAAGELMRHV